MAEVREVIYRHIEFFYVYAEESNIHFTRLLLYGNFCSSLSLSLFDDENAT